MSCVLLGTGSLALGQTTTFANFTQDTGADKSFQFTNTGGFLTQNTVTLATAIPVNFTFLVPTSSTLISVGTPVAANLTITSVMNGPATVGTFNATQRLSSVQMTFIGTGALAGQNLLTVFSSTGTLTGTFGASTAGLSETNNGGAQVVSFSSDFLDFSGSTQRNYSLPLNNLDPIFSAGGGSINNFTSNATGQFASNGIVPEPTSMALFTLGTLGFVVLRRRSAR